MCPMSCSVGTGKKVASRAVVEWVQRSHIGAMSSITAIIPTYNRSKLLLECIASIREQTRPVDEIIVVDDGSTDDTGHVVRSLPGPIRYLRQENAGKSAALNTALKEAQGEFIWICDDDDLALPEAAEALSTALIGTPHSFAFGRHLRFRGDGSARQVTHGGYWPDNPEDTWVAGRIGGSMGAVHVLARTVMRRTVPSSARKSAEVA